MATPARCAARRAISRSERSSGMLIPDVLAEADDIARQTVRAKIGASAAPTNPSFFRKHHVWAISVESAGRRVASALRLRRAAEPDAALQHRADSGRACHPRAARAQGRAHAAAPALGAH